MPDSEHEPDIETGADTLLDFLEEKSRYSVSQISEDLGIPEDQVEKWARALENSGLVEIDYSAIKGMVLEYASDKSVDELNQGRHELSLETDTVEINVEDIEEAQEAAEGEAKDSEAGFVEKAEEKEDTEEDREKSESRPSEGSEDTTEPSSDSGGSDSLESGEGSEESEESEDVASEGRDIDFGDSSGESEDVTESSGEAAEDYEDKSGSGVSISEKDSDEESGGPSVTMKAKKAMLNKMKRGGSSSEEDSSGGSKGSVGEGSGSEVQDSSKDVSEELDSNLSHIKSKSSGKYQSKEDIDWNPGDDIEEVDQNIKELSDLLLDPEVDDEEVYDRIDYQTEVLKDKLKEEPLEERDNEEELREDIVDTIDLLNEKIEKSDSAKSKIKSVLRALKQYLAKFVHAIGIKKVE